MNEPPDRYTLTPETYDGVTSALIGNGELCTTVGPTGFHTPREQQSDIAHRTQRFVMAGRRLSGPQRPLINLGSVSRIVLVDGLESESESWQQFVSHAEATIRSRLSHRLFDESGSTTICWNTNIWWTSRLLKNRDSAEHDLTLRVTYDLGDLQVTLNGELEPEAVVISQEIEDHVGDIIFRCTPVTPGAITSFELEKQKVTWEMRCRVKPGRSLWAGIEIQFSDRLHFQFPLSSLESEDEINDTGPQREFWSASTVETGDEPVDAFRSSALYTLRCQATPWSVPPTVSEEYWGAGAFHDEMYPFLGLLSSNHVELAERIPYFRLSTLPQAMQRARGRGALYPWSSTEYGEERDPNGLWLTERFHLGQFAVCIWMLWLYNRDRIQLDDLYPVLREIARYFEMNMLERDEEGKLRTKACVDFDESVGPVTNGPFTICAAIASLEYAANAAEVLGKDPERIPRWRELAGELRKNLPTDFTAEDAEGAETFGIPGGKPLHYSILGPIFPFRVEVDSERAKASAEYIHRVCRSTKGWKPGFSEVFEGSSWMWTAAHLGIVHAMQGNAELAWEAIKEAPASAGPFLSPNEHVDKDGVIHVPWFTTGCGGWIYALNCLFVQVDEEGTKLLPAVPAALSNARFRDIRADRGVLVSAEFKYGVLARLSARAPKPMPWCYRIPSKYAEQADLGGKPEDIGGGWLCVSLSFADTESVSLLDTTPLH